ncbi:hypothetical protein HPB51_029391 [Rhipicephalus microplus]|uniref:Uncharacterized protein n=1 Tax=Rhipicephalus microplus TaxID=6941 RepID=A0A9J6CUP3_RHIMP|nr:hypothetical protein HPB51_029391 [Rhipicephalus microplus]
MGARLRRHPLRAALPRRRNRTRMASATCSTLALDGDARSSAGTGMVVAPVHSLCDSWTCPAYAIRHSIAKAPFARVLAQVSRRPRGGRNGLLHKDTCVFRVHNRVSAALPGSSKTWVSKHEHKKEVKTGHTSMICAMLSAEFRPQIRLHQECLKVRCFTPRDDRREKQLHADWMRVADQHAEFLWSNEMLHICLR